MNLRITPALLASILLLVGCDSTLDSSIPQNRFRLVIDEVANDPDLHIVVMKIETQTSCRIKVDRVDYKGEGRGSSSIGLVSRDSRLRTGQLLLSASHFVEPAESATYLKVDIRLQDTESAGRAGGPAIYPESPDLRIRDFFKISAEEGVYDFGTPLVVATVSQRPITVTVVPR